MSAETRSHNEITARRQGWEDHAREHFQKYPRGGDYEPMSAREAYIAGWKDRAEWGYQDIPTADERAHDA